MLYMVKGRDWQNMFKSVDQSQHTGPADQSKHIAILGRMGFMETRTKWSDTDRLGIEMLQQWQIREKQCFFF